MSLALILLAIIIGLPSVKFEVILEHNFTKGFIKSGAYARIATQMELLSVRVELKCVLVVSLVRNIQ